MQQEWSNLQQKIAEKNGVSCIRVEQDLQQLIEVLWQDSNPIPKKHLLEAGNGQKPSPMELVSYLANAKEHHRFS